MHRLLALALLAGCTPTTFAFSPTINGVPSRPDNCPVDVLTTFPSRGYQEIGTLELYNGPEPKTLDAFKKAVTKQVCETGGDAVVGVVDDKGVFSKGTVIGYTDKYGAPPAKGSPPEQKDDNELPGKK
ncbi:MAG: hypothetical protein ACM31C_32885 [Acidobacteriota bacterium]